MTKSGEPALAVGGRDKAVLKVAAGHERVDEALPLRLQAEPGSQPYYAWAHRHGYAGTAAGRHAGSKARAQT